MRDKHKLIKKKKKKKKRRWQSKQRRRVPRRRLYNLKILKIVANFINGALVLYLYKSPAIFPQQRCNWRLKIFEKKKKFFFFFFALVIIIRKVCTQELEETE